MVWVLGGHAPSSSGHHRTTINMNFKLPSLLVTAALCLAPITSAQTGIVDVSVTADNVAYNMGFFDDMQQDIQCTTAGVLEGFKIRMATQDINVGLPVAVFLGSGPHVGTPVWSGTAFATTQGNWEWVFVDCSAAQIQLDVNDIFVIRVGDAIAPTPGVDFTCNQGWPNPFYNFDFFEQTGVQSLTRMTFETYMLPDPLVLIVTGTCGGAMTFDVTTGSGNYWLVYGSAGSSSPFGIDLDIANPQLATTMGAHISVNVPAGACGLTVQAIDMANFVASNPVVL